MQPLCHRCYREQMIAAHGVEMMGLLMCAHERGTAVLATSSSGMWADGFAKLSQLQVGRLDADALPSLEVGPS